MNLGYACINLTMGKKITTNRTMIKKTLDIKGLDYVSELSLANTKDIIKILQWNNENQIKFFRLSSAIIPWGDKLDITKLKHYEEIKKEFNSPIEFDRLLKMKVMTWTFNLRIEELIWIFWNKLRHEELED